MATFRQRGMTWRAEVYKHGHRESATFPSKRQAIHWAREREASLALLPVASVAVRQSRRLVDDERRAANDAADAFCSLRVA